DWGWFERAKRSGRIYDNSLERGAGSARSIPGSPGGIGKTLPHLLATCLWFHQASRHSSRGGGRSYSGIFFAAARAPRFRRRPEGERATAVLSVNLAQTFPCQRTPSRNDGETRQRTTADSAGRTECKRATRTGRCGCCKC